MQYLYYVLSIVAMYYINMLSIIYVVKHFSNRETLQALNAFCF